MMCRVALSILMVGLGASTLVLSAHGKGEVLEEAGHRLDRILEEIEALSSSSQYPRVCGVSKFKPFQIKVQPKERHLNVQKNLDMAVEVLESGGGLDMIGHEPLRMASLKSLMRLGSPAKVLAARIVVYEPFLMDEATDDGGQEPRLASSTDRPAPGDTMLPWWIDRRNASSDFMDRSLRGGLWSFPYFVCKSQTWQMSYSLPIIMADGHGAIGFMSVDFDLTSMDINQCNYHPDDPLTGNTAEAFMGQNRCPRSSSKCHFVSGRGWRSGSYTCRCRLGYFQSVTTPSKNGTTSEAAPNGWNHYSDLDYGNGSWFCQRCQPGCGSCTDDSQCLSTYNWELRYVLLGFSMLCSLLSLLMIALVIRYRKNKVFYLSSPIFLCLTLVGCSIMYMEMLANFPVLDWFSCVATKWTRNMGFTLTFSALFMKTWRVYLTFRVKSAYKVRMTDKHLLQWLFPVLLLMVVYLGAWTLSDPPEVVYVKEASGLKYLQCEYGWWDHLLAIGEVMFLGWGVYLCFLVRRAESVFNEATYIRWSMINIAVTNVIMITFHLWVFPDVSPDIKYLMSFLRIQSGTSTSIFLVFGPKVYRVFKGTSEDHEDRAAGGSSFQGESQTSREKDNFIENEELKEEVQKLAAQVEYLKIVGMMTDNRHIVPKKDGYFAKSLSCTRCNSRLERSFRRPHQRALIPNLRGRLSSFHGCKADKANLGAPNPNGHLLKWPHPTDGNGSEIGSNSVPQIVVTPEAASTPCQP